jgi:peptidoglycan/LPS O-acetylase OafA/YrhL
MTELLPILGGFVLGALLHALRRRGRALRSITSVVGAAGLGVLAAFVSGELHASWGFALVDVGIVAVAAVAGRVSSAAAGLASARRGVENCNCS